MLHAQDKRAFTLMEFLIIMAIIAALFAFLITAATKSKTKAYQTKCALNLKNLGSALLLYASDFSGDFPPGSTHATNLNYADDARNALFPDYIRSMESFYCPANQDYAYLTGAGTDFGANSAWPYGAIGYCYLADYQGVATISDTLPAGVESGANLPLMADFTMLRFSSSVYTFGHPSGTTLFALRSNHKARSGPMADGANVLYVDGSVEWKLMPEESDINFVTGVISNPTDDTVDLRINGGTRKAYW